MENFSGCLTGGRNREGLSERQIENCMEAWAILCGNKHIEIDYSSARNHSSCTKFNEEKETVFLGADAYPGDGLDANSRMSMLACLAHELSHAERFQSGYNRPTVIPDVLIDEAETSLRASFMPTLCMRDREDLVEDARNRLSGWICIREKERSGDES